MKVCFLMRSEFEKVHGGDVVQVKKYVDYLSNYGIKCFLRGEFPQDEFFDIYIIVNIDRPIELFGYYQKIKKTKKPYYLIPIHHPIDAVDFFEKNIRGGIGGVLARFFPLFYSREKIKNFFRMKSRAWYLPLIIKTLFKDYVKIIGEVISNSRGVFCISLKEEEQIKNRFNVTFNCYPIKNAVDIKKNDTTYKVGDSAIFDIVVVGRIEKRKNQINIVDALKSTNLNVLFIGALNANEKDYSDCFIKEIRSYKNMVHIEALPQRELFSYYRKSKVLLNASYFEVSPLVDIEAAILGCRVVSTENGYSSENILDLVTINPNDKNDILSKCISQCNLWPRKHELHPDVYSWSNAGKIILEQIENCSL